MTSLITWQFNCPFRGIGSGSGPVRSGPFREIGTPHFCVRSAIRLVLQYFFCSGDRSAIAIGMITSSLGTRLDNQILLPIEGRPWVSCVLCPG